MPPQHVPSSLGPVDFSACPAAERALPAAERGKISLDFLACSNLSFDPSSFLTVPFETNPFFLSSLSLSLSLPPRKKGLQWTLSDQGTDWEGVFWPGCQGRR